ncbi:MAG: hypothetical protein ACRDRT_09480, partial [Pseudonocardiaceae bacterium]
ADARRGPNLRELDYSPDVNPLVITDAVRVKRRTVRTVARQDMANTITGEITGVAAIYTTESVDEAQFVKVFAEGVKAAFALSRTAYRVFQLVLDAYQQARMTGGYADSVYLAWFDGGLSGQSVGMTDRTFQTGLKELLAKSFIAPRSPNLYWVNPALFFKGDRVAFVKEYTVRAAAAALRDPHTVDMLTGRSDMEGSA